MKTRNIFKLFVALLFSYNAFSQDSTLIKKKDLFSQDSTSIKKKSLFFIPDYVKMQFAGNIGFFSVGVGYQFLNNHLYSELLYGYVPASISKAKQIHTITIKNTFPIVTKKFNTFALSPITGFTISFETGNNSFLILPDKYPKNYYSTNAFHLTFFIGASVHKDFINSKIIQEADLHFELGAVDTYLWYAITSKEVKVNKIVSSAIGINLYLRK